MNNETILNYINSKDIRNHLRLVGYQFTSLETAWLIFQCESLTLSEKHEAWNDLISTMPDMSIDLGAFKHHKENSLYDFLKRYMDVDNRWIQNFKAPGNYIYQFSATTVLYNGRICFVDNDCVFSSFENCLNAAKKEMSDCDEIIKDCFKVKITKREIDNAERQENVMELCLNHKFHILYVEHYGNAPSRKDFETHIGFEEMCFSFPAPFKRGDIIYDITGLSDDFCSGPMVMNKIAPDIFAGRGRLGHDVSDMVVVGYFQNPDTGNIYEEDSYNYMNYEYYPMEKLKGKRRILLAISNLLKGKIDIGLCLKAYHKIMLEEFAISLKPNEYTKETLGFAGLTKE